jgi:hypothetical protein
MATTPTLTFASPDEDIVKQLLGMPIAAAADRIKLADASAALVCVLIETDQRDIRTALCNKLLQTLSKLRECSDTELPPHLIAEIIEGERISTCVPACWQEMSVQVDYALALTQAVLGGTLPASVEKTLTALLHDMVWLLAEYVKEPSGTAG